MIHGLYDSAAGMLTNEYRQAVLANNLANSDTVGFQRDLAVFAERTPAAQAGIRSGASDPSLASLSGGMWLGRTYTDFQPGPVIQTDNALDVAIQGPGFLSVGVDGKRLLTRDGRMKLDSTGKLVAASDGSPILGRGGMLIQLNPVGGPPSICEDGRIEQDGAIVGELDVVDFPDYSTLRKVGDCRLQGPDEGAVRAPALLKGGYIENSSVQPLNELVNMIEATRSYQMNAQMISLQDQTIGRLIGVISR